MVVNAIEAIEREICHALPETSTKLRRPRNPNGEWWLDVKLNDYQVTIQWSLQRGFGVSASGLGDGYGEGPDEVFERPHEILARVVELLRTKTPTVPPLSSTWRA